MVGGTCNAGAAPTRTQEAGGRPLRPPSAAGPPPAILWRDLPPPCNSGDPTTWPRIRGGGCPYVRRRMSIEVAVVERRRPTWSHGRFGARERWEDPTDRTAAAHRSVTRALGAGVIDNDRPAVINGTADPAAGTTENTDTKRNVMGVLVDAVDCERSVA